MTADSVGDDNGKTTRGESPLSVRADSTAPNCAFLRVRALFCAFAHGPQRAPREGQTARQGDRLAPTLSTTAPRM
jgi:hypothetical protein